MVPPAFVLWYEHSAIAICVRSQHSGRHFDFRFIVLSKRQAVSTILLYFDGDASAVAAYGLADPMDHGTLSQTDFNVLHYKKRRCRCL